MSYIGQTLPADTFQGFTTDSFTGDGSATTFTLSKTPFNESALLVVINNVVQKPTTNFTVSGTTLTIVGTAVASGDVIYATHIGGALPIGQAASLDLNGASDQLILDADADTTISADTDDQIDFKLGGVDEMTMSASGIVINEGSNDRDFRIESNANTHQLYVDGGVPFVGISSIDSAVSQSVNGGDIPALQIKGTTSGTSSALLSRHANDGNGPILFLYKSRNATPGSSTIVQDDDQCGQITFLADDGTDGNSQVARIRADIDGSPGANDTPGRLVFMTTADGSQGATERMRIHENGNVGIGNTGGDYRLKVESNADNSYAFNLINSHGSNAFGQYLRYSAYAPDGSGNNFFFCADTTANRLFIQSDGDIINHDNSYGQISDERIKQDIRDSNSQWDDIKAVKVRNFKRKDDVRQYGDKAWEQIGVVAQELETAGMDKLIKNNDPSSGDILSDSSFGTLYEDGDTLPKGKEIGDVKEIKAQVKSVKYSILYMKAIKALQEAMAKIETLETKVKALEDA
jgi:hypothetical protein